jgi:putative RNA 2'-phosphotransferase
LIKECLKHGYFRAEQCPKCEEPGRFLMNDEEVEQLGRMMAGILRHFPDRFELTMDSHGWVPLIPLVDAVRARRNQFHWLKPHHIIALAATDQKGRYQCDNDKVRATYGHSLDIDLDLPTDNIPAELFYPATEEELPILLETGLKPSDRKQVHLSLTPENALTAGSHRTEKPVILRIDAKKAIKKGVEIMRAGPTVFITKEIPAPFLSKHEIAPAVQPEVKEKKERKKKKADEEE